VLIKLAPHFRKIVRKHLVIAGILVEQAAEVEAAYRDRGFGPARTVTRGDWVRLELEPQ
jgi:ribosomal protein L11 methylase PrmA